MGYVEKKNHLFSYKLFKAQSVKDQKEIIKIEVKNTDVWLLFFFFIFIFFQDEGEGQGNISKRRSRAGTVNPNLHSSAIKTWWDILASL